MHDAMQAAAPITSIMAEDKTIKYEIFYGVSGEDA